MSVRNAGTAIKEARLKAGLSQKKLSEGICSALSLSRIENGTAGVSPSTFQALMAHAGAPCEAFPIFASRTDFDCFYSLKRVRFYLDSWQLQEAYDELDKIEQKNFAENKFYYQEWLLLHCKLQFRSGCADHREIYDTLLDTLHISRPEMDFSDFRSLLLSLNEIELLIAFAQEALYLDKLEVCLNICMQISSYLENSQITFLEKDRLLAENAIVYAKYLVATKEYDVAFQIADKFRHKMVVNSDDAPLHELTFLTGLGYYYKNDSDNALIYFKTAFFSAHSLGSCYATVIHNYLTYQFHIVLPLETLEIADIPLISFATKKIIDTSVFSDGTYDLFSAETLTIGGLIRELRSEQKISQSVLCQGLCSKSKLSKIENGTLQPSVILTEMLLQRLGITDTVFTFFGDNKEAHLEQIKVHLAKTPYTCPQKIKTFIAEAQPLLTPSNQLYNQWLLFKQATIASEASSHYSLLHKALEISLPGFSFDTIKQYRLSWTELTILNNIAHHYSYGATPSMGILKFYKILEFFSDTTMDILEKKRIFPITIEMLVLHLYRQRRYNEILELSNVYSDNCLKYSISAIAHIHAHYCQALGKCNNLHLAKKYAIYTYYNFLILELTQKAEHIRQDFQADFQIKLI